MIYYYDRYGNQLGDRDFIEVRWERKWDSCDGQFSLYIPASTYNPEIKYIMNDECGEWGVVQKILYQQKVEGDFVTLEGLTLTGLLNFGSCWVGYGYEASDTNGVRDMIRCWIASSFNLTIPTSVPSGYSGVEIPFARPQFWKIELDSSSVYPDTIDIFVDAGELFGDIFLNWLSTEGFSVAVTPLFNAEVNEADQPLLGLKLKIVQGRDLTDSVFFGKAYDDVSSVQYSVDESGERSTYIAVNEVNKDDRSGFTNVHSVPTNDGIKYYIAQYYSSGTKNRPSDMGYCFPAKVLKTSVTTHEVSNTKARNQMTTQAKLDILNNYRVENVVIDVIQNRFIYLEDYNLGDTCSILIDELKIEFSSRIVGVTEVYSQNTKEVTIILGTPKKEKYKKGVIII